MHKILDYDTRERIAEELVSGVPATQSRALSHTMLVRFDERHSSQGRDPRLFSYDPKASGLDRRSDGHNAVLLPYPIDPVHFITKL